jgi:sugar phosphate permease
MPEQVRQSRIFYGWWIVGGGSIVMALGAGLNFYGFSAFFIPLSDEFGWSRGALAGVFALSRLEGGFLGPVEGWMVDRFGPRKMMFLGLPLMGLGFILLSQVQSLFELYLVYIFTITLGGGLGTFSPVGAAVANWFSRLRGRALGFVMAGNAVGGGILLPVIGWWITEHGWRHASVSAGILVFVVGIPLALVIRHRPEQYGMLPDGDTAAINDAETGVENEKDSLDAPPRWKTEITARQSLKTSAFWFLGTSLAARSLVTTGLTIHFVAMMVDRGFSLTAGSGLLGSVAMVSVIGRIGLPWLGDKMDKRHLMFIAYTIMGATMFGVSQVDHMGAVFALMSIYAVAYGGSIVLPIALQADYYGRYSFATVRGLLHVVQTTGMLIGPVMAGLVYDYTNSYDWAFLVFGVAGFTAAALVLCLRRPRVPSVAV